MNYRDQIKLLYTLLCTILNKAEERQEFWNQEEYDYYDIMKDLKLKMEYMEDY